jgi:hypothetical protein
VANSWQNLRVGRRLVPGTATARRLAPPSLAALAAVFAAAAGFHELPNLFQLASTLTGAVLAGLATWGFKKIRKLGY